MGRGSELYNDDLQRAIQKPISITVLHGGTILPFNHPPFEAGFFVPFASLPYSVSYLLWLAINLLLALGFAMVVRPHLEEIGKLPLWFLALGVFAFPPLFVALMQGQDVIWVLFCYGCAYAALRRGSEFKGGSWLALGLCKFHLVLPFLFALVWQKRIKLIAGFVVVASILAVVGFGLVGVRESLAYPGYVWKTDHTPSYRWSVEHNNNPNIRALLLNMLGGDSHWASAVVVAASILLLMGSAIWWRRFSLPGDVNWRLAFALNMVVTVLVSYHTWIQDMTLLLLPIIVVLDVLAAQHVHTKRVRITLLGAIAVLFFSPLYLVLLLKFDEFFLMTAVILIFVAGLVGLMNGVRAQEYAPKAQLAV